MRITSIAFHSHVFTRLQSDLRSSRCLCIAIRQAELAVIAAIHTCQPEILGRTMV